MFGQHQLLIILVGFFLVGCKGGESNQSSKISSAESKPSSIEPDSLGNLIEIEISPPEGQSSVPAQSKMKLKITGIYENGTEDLTEQAELRILDDVSNITFTADNQIQAGVWDSTGAYNDTRIEAEFENIKAELTVNVMAGVCDKTLTLSQMEALDGTCVKSYTYDGKEYVFTPRKKFMDELGYTADSSSENQGRTYAKIHNDDYPYALFTRYGKGMTWENFTQGNLYGQAERFCHDLVQMSFNNKDGWKLATLTELEGLITHHLNNNLMETEGLPLHYFTIWSDDKLTNQFGAYARNVTNGTVAYYLLSKQAIVCRSE